MKTVKCYAITLASGKVTTRALKGTAEEHSQIPTMALWPWSTPQIRAVVAVAECEPLPYE